MLRGGVWVDTCMKVILSLPGVWGMVLRSTMLLSHDGCFNDHHGRGYNDGIVAVDMISMRKVDILRIVIWLNGSFIESQEKPSLNRPSISPFHNLE